MSVPPFSSGDQSGLLSFIVDSVDALVSYVDSSGNIRFANKAFETWFGIKCEFVAGQSLVAVFGSEAAAVLQPFVQRVLSGESVEFDATLPKANDVPMSVHGVFAPHFGAGPEVVGFALRLSNVTDERKAEANRKFMERASDALSRSLDYTETLSTVANLAVTSIADWCVVKVVEEDGTDRKIVAHADPEMVKWAKQLEDKYPPDPSATAGEPQVLRTGVSELYSNIPHEMLAAAARDEEHLRVIEEAKIRSAMVVPICSEKRVLGVITFVSSAPNQFTADELAMAEELAARASLAIRNAQLYHAATQEIAERERTEELIRVTEQRYRLLVDQSPLAIQTFAKDGTCITANCAWEELWQTSRDNLRGYNILQDSQLEENGLMPYVKQCFAGKAVQPDDVLYDPAKTGKPGRPRWIRSLFYPILDESGAVLEVVLVLQDITNERDAQQTLLRSQQELENLVTERTAELQRVNRELEAFSFSVSHDLRAPLRTISGFTALMLEDQGPLLDEEGKDSLRRIIDASKRMSQLIENLLQFARLSRSEIRAGDVDFSEIANAIANDLRTRDPGRQVRVDVEPGMTAYADRGLIRVALENLMENSWKFTSKTADACIEVGTRVTGDETVYYVKDNGAGFDMKYVHKLFKAFERLHGEGDFPGTGIGLTNVQRIVERHGGRLWAEGEQGKGATFSFTLPQPVRE